MGQIKSKETWDIIATNEALNNECEDYQDCQHYQDSDSSDDDIPNVLQTINTITGDYVEVDYDEETETVITKASEIFCYGELKNHDGIAIITKDEAEHLAWMQNPKLVYKGNSGSCIITPDNGFSYISLNDTVFELGIRVLEVALSIENICQDIICHLITELEVIVINHRTSEILSRFDHNIPNVSNYVLVDRILYHDGKIIRITTQQLCPESVSFKSIGGIDVFAYDRDFVYVNIKTKTYFVADSVLTVFIKKKLDQCESIAVMRSIAKLHMKNGNLVIYMNDSEMELEGFEDMHLPARPQRKSKSARN